MQVSGDGSGHRDGGDDNGGHMVTAEPPIIITGGGARTVVTGQYTNRGTPYGVPP